MLFLRRILSLILSLFAFSCLAAFVALFAVRNLGDKGEVSQVFHLDQAVALGGGRYLGVYNVAITPKEKTAQVCDLVALTPGRYVNLLDRQVWLWPVDAPLFAYDESTESRILMWASLVAGFILPFIAFYLWKKD